MDDNNQVESLWADALRLYQDKSGRDILKEPGINQIRTTNDLLQQLELKDVKFATYRKKNDKFWRVLSSCMQPIAVFGGLTVSGLSLSPFAPASQVLGAVLFLVKAADGVSEAYDRISDMFETLQDCAVRIAEYAKFEMNDSLKRKITSIMALSEKMIKKGRVIQDAVDRLNRLFDAEQKLVIAQTYSTTQGLVRSVDEVALALNDSRLRTDENAERKIIRESLNSPAAEKIRELYAEINERRLPGTGEWILREPLFQQWLNGEISILWILGGPGAGKSFLSSTIVEHLHREYSQPTSITVGYFYIKEDDIKLRSVNTILKTFALQLAEQDPEYRTFIAAKCKIQDNFSSIRSTWKNLFLDFYASSKSSHGTCYLLIDGLDEALRSEREGLLRAIQSLDESHFEIGRPMIHIVLVGRPDLRDDIWSIWEKQIISIEVSAAKNQHDIAEYIQKGLSKVKLLRNRKVPAKDRQEMTTEIIKKLTDGNGGMFLWVNLMFDQIQHKQRKSQLQAALNDAPTDLHKMISSVFDRLADNPAVLDIKDDLNEILAWVSCAQRPLFLGELEDILKMRPPIGEGLPGLEDLLRSQFASFFTITRNDNLSTNDLIKLAREDLQKATDHESSDRETDVEEFENFLNPDEGFSSDPWSTVIQFSHASIRDYLVSEKARELSTSELGIEVSVSRTEYKISKLCLEVLCGVNLTDTAKTPDKFYDANGRKYKQYPKAKHENIWRYCNEYFVDHLASLLSRTLELQDRLSILRLLYTLFFDRFTTERWYLFSGRYNFLTTWFIESKSRLCIRAWFQDITGIEECFTPEECAVIIEANSTPKRLLKNIATVCGDLWLQDERQKNTTRSADMYMFVVYVYSILDDADALAQLGNGNSWQKISWRKICSEKQIRDLAESFEIVKTYFWHGRLGETLLYAGWIDQAVHEISIGLTLEPDSVWLLLQLSASFRAKQAFYPALQASKTAVQVATATEDWIGEDWSGSCFSAALLADRNNNIEETIEYSKKGYEPYVGVRSPIPSRASSCIFLHMKTLYHISRYDDLGNLAADLQLLSSSKGKFSLLSELIIRGSLSQYHNRINTALGMVARQSGDIQLLSDRLEEALEYAKSTKSSFMLALMRQNVAWIKYRFMGRSEESLALWELILNTMTSDEEKTGANDNPWTVSVGRLAQTYLRRAYEAEANGEDPQQWITKIERWATRPKPVDPMGGSFTNIDATLVLGIWSCKHERPDLSAICFRTYVQDGFIMLGDKDLSNDMYGYEYLAWFLFYNNDLDNFHACIKWMFQLKHAIWKHHGILKEDPSIASLSLMPTPIQGPESILPAGTSAEEQQNPSAPAQPPPTNTELKFLPDEFEDVLHIHFRCNGDCSLHPPDLSAYYACHSCPDARFCQKCYDKFLAGGFEFDICRPGHIFTQVIPQEEQTLGIDMMDVRGVIMKTEVWLDGIRKKWYS